MICWRIYCLLHIIILMILIIRGLKVFVSSTVIRTIRRALKIILHIRTLKRVWGNYSIIVLRHVCWWLKHINRGFHVIIIICIINRWCKRSMYCSWRLSTLIVWTLIRVWRMILWRRVKILARWKMSSIFRILIGSIYCSCILRSSSLCVSRRS